MDQAIHRSNASDVRETFSGNGDRLPEFESYLLYFPGIFKTLLGGLIEKLLTHRRTRRGGTEDKS